MERLKAFCYLRVSGKAQIDGDGFDRQLIACETYAAANNIDITEVFREEGVSGTKELDDRPALSELLAALEENGVKTILIEKVDRLARDLMVQETIIGDMQRSGYTIISVAEPDLCSQDPSRILIRQIFGAIAQYDKSITVLKLKGARQRIAKQGRHPGAKNYSTDPRLNKKSVGRHFFGQKPGEADTLERMKALQSNGLSYDSIAHVLNNLNSPTRMNKRWHGATINKILNRPDVA